MTENKPLTKKMKQCKHVFFLEDFESGMWKKIPKCRLAPITEDNLEQKIDFGLDSLLYYTCVNPENKECLKYK